MAAIGRNDPCPCGSGKKYKQCHLRADEEAHAPKLSVLDLRQRLIRLCAELIAFAEKRLGREATAAVLRSWPGDPELARGEAPLVWALFHTPHEDRTVAQRFREARKNQLDARGMAVLDASMAGTFSLFRVEDASPSRTVLVDAFSGARHELGEPLPWGPSSQNTVVLARPIEALGTQVAQLGWAPLPADSGSALVEQLKAAHSDPASLKEPAGQRALLAAFEGAVSALPEAEPAGAIVHERIAVPPEKMDDLKADLDYLRAEEPDLRAELFDDAIELEAVGETSEAARAQLQAIREKLGLG